MEHTGYVAFGNQRSGNRFSSSWFNRSLHFLALLLGTCDIPYEQRNLVLSTKYGLPTKIFENKWNF